MKILISMSAKAFVEGDRVAAEFDKNDWAAGTILKATPTGYRIDFDYGETKLLKAADIRFLPIGSKKFKKGLTLAEVKALKPAAKPAAKATPAKKATPVKPAAKTAPAKPAAAKATPAKKATPASRSFIGSVVKSRFGDIAILTSKRGRKYNEYKWSTVSGKPGTGWLKLPMSSDYDEAFRRYPFVRAATPDEMKGGHAALNEIAEKKSDRLNQAYDSIKSQDIKAGDIVLVTYSNGTKKEAVLDVDYRAGKLAIVRQQSGAAALYTKRRLLPVRFCTKVVDGGGTFDPNNPIYEDNGIYIPQFYKEGNTVAKRSPRGSSFW